jgi:DNA polymerase-4
VDGERVRGPGCYDMKVGLTVALEALGLAQSLGERPRADVVFLVTCDEEVGSPSFGAALHKLCRGIDERPVAPARVRKSFSVETTYRHDLPDLAACRVALLPLVAEFSRRLAATHGLPPVNKAFVKVKFDDFTQTTAECGASRPDETVWAALLETAWRRGRRAVRLLGVGVRFGEGPPQQDQLGLFGPHIDMESGAV